MKTGLFIVSYEITTGLMGAPRFEVHLTVSTPNQRVNGQGNITDTSNPPLDLMTTLHGDYTYMTVMPKNTKILVVTEGYPTIKWPPNAGIGPVLLPNTKLRMVLEEDWSGGTANFSYLNPNGRWVDIEDAKVSKI
ncbi:DUF1842 domain-containing protein [Kordia sp. YSTF-M3]|uniref:DUF1842 domain-containing protein n=1 Tax=Kordia aestuariivivens TaxID=2759037 RepID=A0ABR7Q5Q5_9FLAO|nr:DUF1842 domain-containing protein [Kordia aestuariivivens]MBC8753894.1 DUF1842 domain-containing protein [Kordia aestuariivivens]